MSKLTKAVQQAKKELEKEQIEEIKEMIKDTLEAIEEKKAEIADSQKDLLILKQDLKDIEAGRLNRIKERKEKDKRAREISKIDLDELPKGFIGYSNTSGTSLQSIPMIISSDSTTTLGQTTADYKVSSINNISNTNLTASNWSDIVGGTYVTKSGKTYFID